jgi:predicted nucleotidyltransferase
VKPSVYANKTGQGEPMQRLKGKNRIREFKKVAEALTSKIASHEGVAGVILIGGLTRGFADKYSDIDMITLLSRKDENLRNKLRKIGSDEQKRSGIDIDLEVHFLEDFRARKWDEAFKWDLSHAKIIFDPEERIHRLFREKLKVSKLFWFKRIVIYGEYMKWYCCPPKEDMGTMVEAWVERGDLVSAHYCLSYTLDLLIRMLFALNKEFLPAPKWRIFYSYHLRWLPKDYKKLVKEAITVKSLSKQDLNRRMKALRRIWQETLPEMEDETGLTQALISKYYVEKVLHQTSTK